MKAISFDALLVTSHPASVVMSAASTNRPSSRRRRFSSRIFREYGSRASPGKPAFSSAGRLKYWTRRPAAASDVRVLKEFCEAIF